MEIYTAPNGEEIVIPEGRVITFGLSADQNKMVKNALPTKDFELYATDVATDLVAISASAIIIMADALDTDGREVLFDCYTEISGCIAESIFWIGEPLPPHHIKSRFKCFQSVDEMVLNMKYHLLAAYRKYKKSSDFSRKLADSLQILALIRQHPGIRTQELSRRLELPMRTVQRYISTLQAAGEWIEYDTTKKGWQLQDGISILFGDHLRE